MTQQKQNSREIEYFQIQITDSLQKCIEITTRLDERIQVLFDDSSEFASDIKEMKNKLHELDIKTSNLELKMESHSSKIESHSDKWSKLLDWTFKIALTAISTFAAYKLGLN